MQLALVGLSHKTAPVEIRERLAFNSDALRSALTSLVGREEISEAIILSTCNRVEVVVESQDDRLIRDFLCEFHRIPQDSVSKHLYSFRNAEVVRHVFRVAASLDSMMIGEPQILGQVKDAYRIATDAGAVGMHLSALMNRAFAVAKKVRSETGISQSAVSVSYAAVELARKIFGDLSGKIAENLSGQFDGGVADGDCRLRNSRFATNFLCHGKRAIHERAQVHANGPGIGCDPVGIFNLAENLWLANHHRIQTCSNAKNVADHFRVPKAIEML